MVELNLPNFITIAIIATLGWVGLNWAFSMMGIDPFGTHA